MKIIASVSLIVALSASGIALAQSADPKNMDMKGMDMKGMDMGGTAADAKATTTTHHATGKVKTVDPVKGTVTLAHGPVQSLNWPAMTMRFAVKDKMLLDKLAVDKTVTIDFVKQNGDYVVIAVK
jgi:Cu(I)/Ag(I) efflux system periplasmic protein CusF